MNFSKHCWKSWGVHNSLHDSISDPITLNSASMSSWECPEVKKLTSAPPRQCNAVFMARKRIVPLFLTSLQQLSAWTFKKIVVRSMPLWWSIVNPPARISMDRDALVGTRCELRAVTTAKPWIIRVVFANRGLLNDENSFAAIHWLLGHECRWAPIESKIIVIWHDPNVVALSLETARAPQYSWRSLNCRRRWRWSISCWARRAGGQCPSFFMIRRCFTHWEQREWCEKKRILKRCSKSVCQTWSWTSMEPNSFLFNGWLPKE